MVEGLGKNRKCTFLKLGKLLKSESAQAERALGAPFITSFGQEEEGKGRRREGAQIVVFAKSSIQVRGYVCTKLFSILFSFYFNFIYQEKEEETIGAPKMARQWSARRLGEGFGWPIPVAQRYGSRMPRYMD